MSIVVRFKPAGLTTEQYDESVRRLEGAGEWPPDGLEYHIFFGPQEDLRVSEVWASQAQFEAFGERMMPVLTDVGVEFAGAPEIFEVHNTIKP